MKKIATKFVLIAASAFIVGSATAQTDTTQVPVPTDTTGTPAPDTTETPAPDTTSVPDAPDPSAKISTNASGSIAASIGAFSNNVYAITDRELLNSKSFTVKMEEDTEA